MSVMHGTFVQQNDDGSLTIYVCKKYNNYAELLADPESPTYALCKDTNTFYKKKEDGTWPEACIPSTYRFVEGVNYHSLIMTKGMLSDNMRIVLTSDASVLEDENTIGWLSEDWVASNIAEGKSIFGKVGTLTINAGIDTSDATATAADILLGKTAYINGIKVTGEHICDAQNNPALDDTGTSTNKGLTVSGIVGTPIATLTEAFASAEGDYQVTDEAATGHGRVWTLTNNGYTFYFKWSETTLSWVLSECQDDPAMLGFPFIYAFEVGDDPWTSSDWKYSLLGVVQESVTVTQTSGSENTGDNDSPSLDDFADRKYNGFELISDEYGTQVFNETSQVLNGMIVYECLHNSGYYYCVMNDDRSAIIIAYYGNSSIAGNVSVGLLMDPDWQVYTADYPDGLKYPWDAFVSDYSPGGNGVTFNTPLEMNPFSGTYNGGGE